LSSLNANRERAKMIVSLSPGIHLRKLQKLLGTSFSTTRYHVEGLKKDGEIVCSKEGRYQRLYPAGTADGSKATYALLQNETARKVLSALARDRRELRNGDLCEMVKLPRSTVSECTALLSKAGLVRRHLTADGHSTYVIQEREQALELLAAFERNLLDIATDRFTDLWDL
jgi:predicted transcriptional regulator